MDDHQNQLKEEIQIYRKLQDVADNEHFQEFFKLLSRTVADKMIWAFTTGKDGPNIKNWEEFCAIRGEIVARLQPIQELGDAKLVADKLQENLEAYYSK